MNLRSNIFALTAAVLLATPAFAGQAFDSTTVGEDNSLSTGVGSTGPGMSGYKHSGFEDAPMGLSSMSDGKTPQRRLKGGFSRRPIYNNTVDLALPHIR